MRPPGVMRSRGRPYDRDPREPPHPFRRVKTPPEAATVTRDSGFRQTQDRLVPSARTCGLHSGRHNGHCSEAPSPCRSGQSGRDCSHRPCTCRKQWVRPLGLRPGAQLSPGGHCPQRRVGPPPQHHPSIRERSFISFLVGCSSQRQNWLTCYTWSVSSKIWVFAGERGSG